MKFIKPDYTGVSPDNLVSEKISIVGNSPMLIKLSCGDFYLDSLIVSLVTQSGSRITLELNKDYSVGGLNVPVSKRSGKSVYSFIRLEPQVVSTQLQIDCQVFGDKWDEQGVFSGFNDLLTGKRIPFSKVVNVPDTLPLVPHMQQIHDVFGWKPLADGALQSIRDAISSLPTSKENLPVIEALTQYRDKLTDYSRELHRAIRSHIDSNTPCHLELDQQPRNYKKLVGLQDISNVGATKTLEPGVMATAESLAFALLEENRVKSTNKGHASDLNNPHGVNKSQLGLSKLENYAMLYS